MAKKQAMNVKIESSWKQLLADEWEKPYFASLVAFVKEQYRAKTVFPPASKIFAAFDSCPVENVKVVIIGQDPYHGEGQANGLCFSVNSGIQLPPSLINIYKEIKSDIGYLAQTDGNLENWAKQGVLLLNATLTVEAHCAGSHQRKGWETFTDAVIDKIANACSGIVFMLWGNYAIKKGELIDRSRHLVLTSAHPSPLSASRGFFGNHHFSRANEYLVAHGKEPIVW